MVINAIGAVATFVVLVDVVATKFVHGAWIVIAAMPVFVAGFYGSTATTSRATAASQRRAFADRGLTA